MNCGFSTVGGNPSTSGGGGITIPGAQIYTFASGGGPTNGIITTTDATPFFRTWGTLPAVGDAINVFAAMITAQQRTTGLRATWRVQFIGYARDAVGENQAEPYAFIGPSGYDESASGLAPWNTFGVPAGMAAGINFLPGGNIIQAVGVGLAGITFDWKCVIFALPFGTATVTT